MRLEKVFRVSAYLTAALATLALGHAEEPFLPGITWFSLGIGALFFVAFAIEKRWALSLRASNLLALLVIVGAGLWLPYQFFQTAPQLIELSGLLVILPFLGPILMVLLLIESFGTKRRSSFWWVHGLGVLEIGLGCILASDLVFGGLLSAYVICAVWSMYLFYLQRGLESDHADAGTDPRARIPGRTQGLWPAGRIAVVVMIVAMVLFLLTPQRGSKRWDPLALAGRFETPAQTGFTNNVDLNKTGTIEVNDDIAMEVNVEDANHRPKVDLPTDQRWRGAVREVYEHGRWLQPTDVIAAGQQRALEQDGLPDYGPSQYFLNFKVDTREAQGLFLADPVVLDPKSKLKPVVPLKQKAGSPLKWIGNDGSLLLAASPGQTQWRYRQVTIPLPEPDVGPSLFRQPRNGRVQFATEIDQSPRRLMQPIPQIGPWARDLLQRLVAEGKLAKEDAEIVGNDPRRPRLKTPERFEKVARTVSDYLSSSGGFGYSLRLGRHDPKIDPVADFLLNTKQGNCELYATALVLVLRAYGIPTRLVMGYQGAENLGNGHYVVRQSHGHSWVEAMIRRQTPEARRVYWLTLDPTPAAAAEADQGEASWQRWWHDTRRGVRSVWRNFIVDYSPEQQQEVAAAMTSGLQAGGFARGPGGGFAGLPWWLQALGISSVVFVAFLGWRLLKRLRGRCDIAEMSHQANRLSDQQVLASTLYARLVSVFANRRGLKPGRGETPEEFGRAAESLLAEQEITATHASIPAKIVQLFYRARFGNLALSEVEQTEAEQSIAVLESALAASSAPKT